MESARDALIGELKSFRLGRGISVARVLTAPTLRAAVGQHVEPVAVVTTVREFIDYIHNPEQRRAVTVAYGLDPDIQLPRPESRRIRLAETLNKTDRTVLNWENRGIEELATLLLADHYVPRSDIKSIELAAVVENFCVTGLRIDTLPVEGPTHTNTIMQERALLLPCVLFQIPNGWKVGLLAIRVDFSRNLASPKRQIMVQGRNVTEATMGKHQTQNLPVSDGIVAVGVNDPTDGAFYGVYWEY